MRNAKLEFPSFLKTSVDNVVVKISRNASIPKLAAIILFMLMGLMFNACEDITSCECEDTAGYNPDLIDDYVPLEYQDKLTPYMPIYKGNTPPNINGVYEMKPTILVVDSGGSAKPGQEFLPMTMRFSSQNNPDITYEEYQKSSNGDIALSKGDEVKITGSGNFSTTVFVVTTNHSDGVITKSATVISGEKTKDGIKNIRYAFIVLEKIGDENNNKYVKVGTYRVFKDGDELAQNSTWNP